MTTQEISLKNLAYILATGLGVGYTPIAPGTAGSFVALCLFWVLPFSYSTWLIICLISLVIGIWSANIVERDKGKDPGLVVIDEFVGQWITLLFLPKSIILYITGFLLFRAFDIIKPFPADKSQNIKGGLGVMIDDVIVGIYVNILLQLYVYFFQ